MKFKDIPSDQLKKILTDKYGSLQTMDEKMDFISKLSAVEMTDPKHEFAKDPVIRNVFKEFRNEINALSLRAFVLYYKLHTVRANDERRKPWTLKRSLKRQLTK
ncbi:MAG: hypothetical protein K6B44_08760 [Lachnospiraceae bacterium]|nr:hypothetical protein [Lachnospiraceae bacterium]